jgi:hypothetical protein
MASRVNAGAARSVAKWRRMGRGLGDFAQTPRLYRAAHVRFIDSPYSGVEFF